MRIATILGTRPEIIRLSRIMRRLDELCDHTMIFTGQNPDSALSTNVFADLGIRQPDFSFNATVSEGFGTQVGDILAHAERLLTSLRPDRLLILGDTNSGLAAIIAKRLQIPVYHLEAGNRCFDDRVPEEMNRRLIDQCSDVLLPYTERSRANLLREGFRSDRIFVVGNPIREVLGSYSAEIEASAILSDLELSVDGYFLVTMHRAENVDSPDRLHRLVTAIASLSSRYNARTIVSTHPRTQLRLNSSALPPGGEGVQYLPPFGFFDFVKLEMNARCVLTDSGTVQEECCILERPVVTLRDSTERPETVECGSNVISGVEEESILGAAAAAMSLPLQWSAPAEYGEKNVSSTVSKILLGAGSLR